MKCECDYSEEVPYVCDACHEAQYQYEAEAAAAEAYADAFMAQYDYPDFY